MKFGDRLSELRKEKGFTRETFADYLGISKYTLRNYELSVNEPNSSFLKQISDIFDVSIDYLMGATNEKERILPYQLKSSEWEHIKKYRNLDDHGKETVDIVLDREAQRTQTITDLRRQLSAHPSTLIELQPNRDPAVFVLPYYRGGVSAGTGVFILGNEAEDELELPDIPEYHGADYAIDVTGHSMEPDYMDKDVALVSQREEMQIGDIGVFVVNGDAFIKELGQGALISHNTAFPDIIIREGDNVVCLGKVIGKLEE